MKAQIYRLKITYDGYEKILNRTVDVSSNFTMAKLGYLVLAAFDVLFKCPIYSRPTFLASFFRLLTILTTGIARIAVTFLSGLRQSTVLILIASNTPFHA